MSDAATIRVPPPPVGGGWPNEAAIASVSVFAMETFPPCTTTTRFSSGIGAPEEITKMGCT